MEISFRSFISSSKEWTMELAKSHTVFRMDEAYKESGIQEEYAEY